MAERFWIVSFAIVSIITFPIMLGIILFRRFRGNRVEEMTIQVVESKYKSLHLPS